MVQNAIDTQETKVRAVKDANEDKLLPLPNVVGVGIGYKVKGGKKTNEICLKVFVEEKKEEKDLARTEIVPPEYDQVKTDVEEVGYIKALKFESSIRPAKPGYSIGHHRISAGTFGCLVREICPPCRIHILSNNHVLANSNAAGIGDPILQPGRFDGGEYPKNLIARLSRFVPIHFGHTDRYNLVDAALALPTDQRHVIASIVNIGMPKGTVEATLGLEVTKSGRTTETTTGKVIGLDVTVQVGYGNSGIGYFRNQIFTTDMSKGGDSGSLLLSKADQKATGLLFAGSDKVTVHNNIANVLMALGVEIITA